VRENLDPAGDFDGDGVLNGDDNCRFVSNGADGDNQADTDRDGIGDACSVFVELPSGRFEWEPRDAQGGHVGFIVGGLEPINFVYDFTVVRRGPPGDHDYLVQPEIGETGPGQAFVEVKDQDEEDQGEEFTLRLEGEPQPGTNTTLTVVDEAGNHVAGAKISVKSEGVLGETNNEGRLSVEIPIGTVKLRLKAEKDDADGEIDIRFGEDGEVVINTKNEGLSLQIEGLVQPGATGMLLVSDDQGNPVPKVRVDIKIERDAGLTSVDGLLDVRIPVYAEEFSVEASLDEQRGELEIKFTGPQAEGPVKAADGDVETSLTIQLDGRPKLGADVIVVVIRADGGTVSGAEIRVNDEVVGSTDAVGRLTITIPHYIEELEITASVDGVKGELEIKIQ
jgi:hypothetical protein